MRNVDPPLTKLEGVEREASKLPGVADNAVHYPFYIRFGCPYFIVLIHDLDAGDVG